MTIMPQLPPTPLPFDPDNPFVLVPLHQYPEFTFECATLLNSEWPRSRQSRLNSLWSCNKSFPVAMVLVQSELRQVVGFCKISLVPKMKQACFVESVVVLCEMRGKGLGSLLMKKLEDYVLSRKLNILYLSTIGQELFYKKLGYVECEPVSLYAFGLNGTSTTHASEGTETSKDEKKNLCLSKNNQNLVGANLLSNGSSPNGKQSLHNPLPPSSPKNMVSKSKPPLLVQPKKSRNKSIPPLSPVCKKSTGLPQLICKVTIPNPPPPPPPPLPKSKINNMIKTYMKKELTCDIINDKTLQKYRSVCS